MATANDQPTCPTEDGNLVGSGSATTEQARYPMFGDNCRTFAANGPQTLQYASILEEVRKRRREVGQRGKQIAQDMSVLHGVGRATQAPAPRADPPEAE